MVTALGVVASLKEDTFAARTVGLGGYGAASASSKRTSSAIYIVLRLVVLTLMTVCAQ